MTYLKFFLQQLHQIHRNIKGYVSRVWYGLFLTTLGMRWSQNFFKAKFYGPFLWMGFNYLMATEPLRVGSLLFSSKFLEILGTHLINLKRIKS